MLKKLVAELFGTATLVYVACGVAVLTLGSWHRHFGTNGGILITSLAFGLVLAGLAYSIGSISGCHVNPAVSLGMVVAGRMTPLEMAQYWVAQFVGGIAGAGALWVTFARSVEWKKSIGLGADGYGASSMIHVSATGAFIVEALLTALFVFVILSVTTKAASSVLSGLVIGLTLTLVHLFGIAVTGTSVNPARSFGPALMLGGLALHQVWLFLIAPLVGAAAAAGLYRFFHGNEQ